MLGGDLPTKSSSKEKKAEEREAPEPLLAEPAEPLGYLKIDLREVELLEIDALATTSTVRFVLVSDGYEILVTNDKDAKKVIIWETSYRVAVCSYQNHLELHLIRTSQDLLTNQLTRKNLGICVFDWPSTAVIEKGEGGSDDCLVNFTAKGKKKSVAKLTLAWQYRAAPNPYSDLDPLLLAPDRAVLRSILAMRVVEGPAGAIMRYFAYSMKALDLFELAVKIEIETTNELAQLFRGSSLATHIVSEFLALHGDAFLKDILRPLVHKVLQKPPDVELDPSKFQRRDEKDQKAAEKRMTELCTTFLKGISSTIGNNCPPAIREVSNFVQVEVEKKFPGKSQVALAGLLFLRFICPAIVTTDKICPAEECTPQARRALVLVTKVLQNLANDVLFGEGKEPYMAPLNPFLLANKSYANEIYKKIMKVDKKGYDPARYRRRIPVKVYEAFFAFACDSKLISPAQIDAIKERVTREIQPPAAATTAAAIFNGGKSVSLQAAQDAFAGSRSGSGSEAALSKSLSGGDADVISTSASKESSAVTIKEKEEYSESSADLSLSSTPTKALSDSQIGLSHGSGSHLSGSPQLGHSPKLERKSKKDKSGKKLEVSVQKP